MNYRQMSEQTTPPTSTSTYTPTKIIQFLKENGVWYDYGDESEEANVKLSKSLTLLKGEYDILKYIIQIPPKPEFFNVYFDKNHCVANLDINDFVYQPLVQELKIALKRLRALQYVIGKGLNILTPSDEDILYNAFYALGEKSTVEYRNNVNKFINIVLNANNINLYFKNNFTINWSSDPIVKKTYHNLKKDLYKEVEYNGKRVKADETEAMEYFEKLIPTLQQDISFKYVSDGLNAKYHNEANTMLPELINEWNTTKYRTFYWTYAESIAKTISELDEYKHFLDLVNKKDEIIPQTGGKNKQSRKPLQNCTKEELIAKCKSKRLPYSNRSKADLIAQLRK